MGNNVSKAVIENRKTVIILLVALVLYLLAHLDFNSVLMIPVQIIVNVWVFSYVAQQLVDYAETSQDPFVSKIKKTIHGFINRERLN